MPEPAVRTILAVDDDSGLLSIIEEIVQTKGYHLLLAENGVQALEVAEGSRKAIDLLLTDVFMPEMNGLELAGTFENRFPQTKILFMSGYMCPSKAIQEGHEEEKAFLQKPFSAQTLLAEMEKILDRPVA